MSEVTRTLPRTTVTTPYVVTACAVVIAYESATIAAAIHAAIRAGTGAHVIRDYATGRLLCACPDPGEPAGTLREDRYGPRAP